MCSRITGTVNARYTLVNTDYLTLKKVKNVDCKRNKSEICPVFPNYIHDIKWQRLTKSNSCKRLIDVISSKNKKNVFQHKR